jgi:hypothetical protein
MSEEKYHPLTSEEYINLRTTMETIGVRLPENKMGEVWHSYNRLRGVNEKQPCGCQSAAKYWVDAVNYINNWLKERA